MFLTLLRMEDIDVFAKVPRYRTHLLVHIPRVRTNSTSRLHLPGPEYMVSEDGPAYHCP